MLACSQWVSNCSVALWNNASSIASQTSQCAYKISNYLLGGLFRQILLGNPAHTEATQQACLHFFYPDSLQDIGRRNVLKNWEIRSESIEFQIEGVSYLVGIKIYETVKGKSKHTCVRVGGKDEALETADVRMYPLLKAYCQSQEFQNGDCGLRILQFSLHHHQIKNPGEKVWRTWKPTEAIEISRVFFAFLQELKDRRLNVDSLICHSLGSLVLEAAGSENILLPKLLILERALPSVWKVGCKLYHPVAAYALYCGALMAGWGADPEKSILKFFNKQRLHGPLKKDRKVVILEVKEDWYFSGVGAFSKGFVENLQQLGVQATRKCFHVNTIVYHSRAHHAMPLNKLENGPKEDDSPILPLKPYESAASAIIKLLAKSTYSYNVIEIKTTKIIFSFDVESVGLYGEPFSIAYTVVNQDGQELENGYMSCPLENAKGEIANREWVCKNVVPHLPKDTHCNTPEELCEMFYTRWLSLKKKYPDIVTIADYGYPVETSVFIRAIKTYEKEREFTGPYPLHEVDTALLVSKVNRSDYPRTDKELPQHHPLNDARYAARLFSLALKKSFSEKPLS